MRSLYVKNSHTIGQWLLFFCIIANGVGNVITIFGVKPSMLLAVLAIFFTVIESVRHGKIYLKWERKQWLICLFCGTWFCYSIFQIFWVKDFTNYKIGIGQLWINLFLMILLLIHVNGIDEVKFYAKSLISVLSFHVALASYEILTGRHWVATESIWDENLVRTLSNNPNECATLMYCALLGLILYMGIKEKNKLWEYILLVLATISIFLTGSRGVQLGIIVFAMMYLWNSILIKYFNLRTTKSCWLLIILLAVLISFVVFSFFDIPSMIRALSGDGTRESDLYRLALIKDSLKVWIDTFGLGSGPLQTTYLIKMNPHNFLIEMLADYGTFIFLGIIYVLWSIVRKGNNSGYSIKMNSILIAVIPSLLVAGISSSSINKFRLYWVAIVLLFLTPIYLGGNRRDYEKVGRNNFKLSI